MAGAFVLLALAGGMGFYNTPVYLDALVRDAGLPLTSVSLATAAFFAITGVAGLPAAWLVARYDPRMVMLAGVALCAVPLALLGQVDSLLELYAVYLVFGAGFAAASMVPVTAVLLSWFPGRSAGPLALATTGLSTGGAVFVPATVALVDRFGLGAVTPGLGLAFLVVGAGVCMVLLRPRPAGSVPPTVPADDAGAEAARAGGPLPIPGPPCRVRVRRPVFVVLSTACSMMFLAQVGGITHLVSLGNERGLPGVAAAIPLMTVLAVVVRLACVPIVTRVPVVRFMAAIALFQATAAAVLALAQSAPVLFAGAVLLAVSVGNLVVAVPLLVIEVFGESSYARLFALLNLVGQVGVAGGPAVLGVLHGSSGGYAVPFLVLSLASVVAAGLLLAIRPRRPGRLPPGLAQPVLARAES